MGWNQLEATSLVVLVAKVANLRPRIVKVMGPRFQIRRFMCLHATSFTEPWFMRGDSYYGDGIAFQFSVRIQPHILMEMTMSVGE